MSIGEKDFNDPVNMACRPRRLTPRECARLMGFEQPGKVTFRIPVSDTQAYRQFGNSAIRQFGHSRRVCGRRHFTA